MFSTFGVFPQNWLISSWICVEIDHLKIFLSCWPKIGVAFDVSWDNIKALAKCIGLASSCKITSFHKYCRGQSECFNFWAKIFRYANMVSVLFNSWVVYCVFSTHLICQASSWPAHNVNMWIVKTWKIWHWYRTHSLPSPHSTDYSIGSVK